MFGQDACRLFSSWNYEVIAAAKSDLDVTNFASVTKFFDKKKFDFVIHSAAYTKVDDAQTNKDLAFLINAEGAKNMALATKEKNIPIIFISTDYVFDGTKNAPYFPEDSTNPISAYGASKLAGEEKIREINPKHYITRTSWLYGKHGKNFVDTMLSLAQKQTSIKVVNDQFGCPTWTCDLAEGIKNLIEKNAAFGTYHLCNSGITTWNGLAKKIFEIRNLKIEVLAVATEEFPRPAPRPKFSAMNNNNALRSWEEALASYLRE